MAGLEMGTRGHDADLMLARIRELWESEEMGPTTDSAPTLLVGGAVDASFERAARYGDGWIAGGAPPDQFAGLREKLEAAWGEAGRDGSPKNAGLAYFSLGERAEEHAQAYLTDYYSWLGEETAGFIAASAATDAETARGYIEAFDGAGCQELILFPSSSDPGQVDLLADALGM
jgi:alkanesulfonate monooxygenase SsuD/methylene tetrahydromethanopterin reductase-like flavin-dependent oxidoreductase (luciferase family)